MRGRTYLTAYVITRHTSVSGADFLAKLLTSLSWMRVLECSGAHIQIHAYIEDYVVFDNGQLQNIMINFDIVLGTSLCYDRKFEL